VCPGQPQAFVSPTRGPFFFGLADAKYPADPEIGAGGYKHRGAEREHHPRDVLDWADVSEIFAHEAKL
jgi:hypothetical protein